MKQEQASRIWVPNLESWDRYAGPQGAGRCWSSASYEAGDHGCAACNTAAAPRLRLLSSSPRARASPPPMSSSSPLRPLPSPISTSPVQISHRVSFSPFPLRCRMSFRLVVQERKRDSFIGLVCLLMGSAQKQSTSWWASPSAHLMIFNTALTITIKIGYLFINWFLKIT